MPEESRRGKDEGLNQPHHPVILSIPLPPGERHPARLQAPRNLPQLLSGGKSLNFSKPCECDVSCQGAEMRLAPLRPLEPRPPHVQDQKHSQGPRQAMCRFCELGSPEPRLPPRSASTPALGCEVCRAATQGQQLSSSASRTLTVFRRQSHAVGAKGAARRAGAQVAALGGARAASVAEGGCPALQPAGAGSR